MSKKKYAVCAMVGIALFYLFKKVLESLHEEDEVYDEGVFTEDYNWPSVLKK